MHQRHGEMLPQATLIPDDLQAAAVTLRRLERFWIRAADLVQRTPPQFAALANETSRTAGSPNRGDFGPLVSSGG